MMENFLLERHSKIMKQIISLDNVSYKYSDSDCAIKNVSLSICKGEKVALVGNNGAGKSTLMLAMAGAVLPLEGKIYLNEQIVASKNLRELRKAVGIIFQDADNQIIAPTVQDEVSFGPYNLKLSKEEVKTRTDKAIEDMNLDAFRTRPPHYLSGGEKKRVTIADILAMQPQIILMDEPTASLDIYHTEILEEKLEKLNQEGMALVVSTHDVDFVWRWADRVILMSSGEIIADADIEAVFCDDELLKKAGLKRPLLVEISKHLGLKNLPRTIQQFKNITEAKNG